MTHDYGDHVHDNDFSGLSLDPMEARAFLRDVERRSGMDLPDLLRALLRVANGIPAPEFDT